MKICIECKHCLEHLARRHEARVKEALKRNGYPDGSHVALEWVDAPAVSDLNFSSAKEYLCAHPKVVDVDPVTGEATCVYCYKTRANPGLCGKQGVHWEKKGTKDGVIPENAASPSPTEAWIYEMTKEVEIRWDEMCKNDSADLAGKYYGGKDTIELFARMMLEKIGAKVPER